MLNLISSQEPAVLPRNKVLSNDILATTANRGESKMEINDNRRIDSGPEELSRRKESMGFEIISNQNYILRFSLIKVINI